MVSLLKVSKYHRRHRDQRIVNKLVVKAIAVHGMDKSYPFRAYSTNLNLNTNIYEILIVK